MAVFILSNAEAEVSISTAGAELQSFRTLTDNREYIWQGDPRFWAKRSPLLFPIIGVLKNGTYSYQGKRYALSKHGFARDMDFELVELASTSVSLRLTSSEKTRIVYPFDFEFLVTYILIGKELRCTYRVQNVGEHTLLYAIGGHPALLLPIADGESSFSDFYLIFPKDQFLNRYSIPNGLLTLEAEYVDLEDGKLLFSPTMFDRDAWVMKSLASRSVALKNQDGSYGVAVDFEDFDSLGLWSVPSAPFLCVEPWCGYNDSLEASGLLIEKEGILSLEKGEVSKKSWSIRII